MAIQIALQSDRRLILAGNRVDHGAGPEYWNREIAPHLGRNGIEYIGPVNDVQKNELLGKAAALVVPIEWDEPFGIVFVEALACGTPVISCPRGALPEIIEQEKSGFLVEGVESGVNAVKMLHLISRQACRARAVEHFSAEVATSRYDELYQSMIHRAA